jgi:hypothetical protein
MALDAQVTARVGGACAPNGEAPVGIGSWGGASQNDPPGTGLLMGRVHPAGVRNARGWHSPNRLPRKLGGQALTKRLARP